MSPNDFFRARSGQMRILEAVIGAAIIFMVFSVSMFLIRTSDIKVLQERADLDRLGYNVLHRLVESGTIEETLESLGPGFWEAALKTAVQRSIPLTIYFNLTIFNCTRDTEGLIKLSSFPSITNTSPDLFANSLEVSSTSIIYTSKKPNIYFLVFVLARAEGE